jgi:hypothetical protein
MAVAVLASVTPASADQAALSIPNISSAATGSASGTGFTSARKGVRSARASAITMTKSTGNTTAVERAAMMLAAAAMQKKVATTRSEGLTDERSKPVAPSFSA